MFYPVCETKLLKLIQEILIYIEVYEVQEFPLCNTCLNNAFCVKCSGQNMVRIHLMGFGMKCHVDN